MELISLLYGIYPRTDDLRRAYGKWEKGQMSSVEISAKIREESMLYYDLVREASLNYFTDPLFNWFDILRPIALSIEGIKLGPLARYKETNTFYREPEIERIGKLGELGTFREVEENPPFPAYHENGSESYVHFLPGINSFMRMSKIVGNPPEIRERLKETYLEIVKKLKIKRLLIYEPFEATDFEIYKDLNEAASTFLVITGNMGTFNADRGKKFFSIIGDNPYSYSKYCEIPGVKSVNAQSTKVNDNVLQKVKRYSSDFDKLIISNTESFDFLPRVIADKKIFSFKGGE
jgi:5-methyltetrahydropteroyltriglutamate--homocysteine methyltransferase